MKEDNPGALPFMIGIVLGAFMMACMIALINHLSI